MNDEVLLIKIGGSSITYKGGEESLNWEALSWLVKAIKDGLNNENDAARRRRRSYIIVHGAGSFGHHIAKAYGLSGKTEPPLIANHANEILQQTNLDDMNRRTQLLLGLSRTRHSVQKLNHILLTAFLENDIPAVTISPCFGIPNLQAHGGDHLARKALQTTVESTLKAGLIPILHGDAGLYGTDDVGILSGDVLMKIIGSASFITNVVFVTDVDGVFTRDPHSDPNATLIETLLVDVLTKSLLSSTVTIDAAGSTHDHDVTGGLKVRICKR